MKPSKRRLTAALAGILVFSSGYASAQLSTVTTITVDAATNRHPISPLIYGVAFADTVQLRSLNSPLNRSGGNAESCYNWKLNATNNANDWYFESISGKSSTPGADADTFIGGSLAADSLPMITIPTIGWVAKLGPNRATLPSFSVKKYGPQQKTDPYNADSGNGVSLSGKNIVGNDPNDADVPSTPQFESGWVKHIVSRWGKANHGGVRYYIMDNEPGLWFSTHRDVHPTGETMNEELRDIIDYGSMVKELDPGAKIVAPEAWGWSGYFYSGYDQQYGPAHGYKGDPDRTAHGGMAFYPWLLKSLNAYQLKTGKRLLDVLTAHIYPQGGDGGNDISPKVQLLRNRSTRALWDPKYIDESWIHSNIMLIPRMKQWVKEYYPGTKIGITEYNWGAEDNIGGATAQADIWGIFGREGLDLATRWTCPASTTPTFKAMQLYRNYDGHDSTFGDVSVDDKVANPDNLSSFAAIRAHDHALTVILDNKVLQGPTPISLAIDHFASAKLVQVWQLTSANVITRLPNASIADNRILLTLPAQSVTLVIIPKR